MGIPLGKKPNKIILQTESYYSTDSLQSITQRNKVSLFDCAKYYIFTNSVHCPNIVTNVMPINF